MWAAASAGGGGGWFEKEAIFIDTRVEAEGEEVTTKNLKRENCQVRVFRNSNSITM